MPSSAQNNLKALLKRRMASLERQPECPDEYQLASYIDGGLSETDHQAFEVHLADCPFCLEMVGIVARAGESESTVTGNKQTKASSGKRPHWFRAPGWAAAALVVVTVGFFADHQSPEDIVVPAREFARPLVANERSIEPTSAIPELLSPMANGSVVLQDLRFEWKLVPDSLFYDIRIVSDDGELIAEQRVWETTWTLPADIDLQVGDEYFVRVDAFVSEGKALSSEHIAFRVKATQ